MFEHSLAAFASRRPGADDGWQRFVRQGWLALLALLAMLAAGQAGAAAGPWSVNEEAEVRLISASDGVGSQPEQLLGLEFRLNPGWKIYWRSPGDAGLPPQPDWAAEPDLLDPELLWPLPERFSTFGIDTYGYSDRVILPLRARLAQPGQAVQLALSVPYLICEEICIPDQAEVSLALAAGPLSPSAEAEEIAAFLRQVPGQGAEAGLQLANARLAGSQAPTVLQVDLLSDQPLIAPDLFVEGPEGYHFAAPEVRFSDGDRRAELTLAVEALYATDAPLDLAALRLTARDATASGLRGIEWTADGAALSAPATEPATEPATAPATAPARGPMPVAASLGTAWPLMLLFALLGGFLLNLMPCVLPVLSLKLLGFVGKGGGERRAIRRSFLATALGILVSFWVIALALIALRAAGAAVGWGIQFQQPLFLLALLAIIGLFALNLLGGVEIPLPQALAGRIGGGAAGQPGQANLWGDFATGAFATLLATPCSAPFLGTAISFALVQSPLWILLLFSLLGLGMALPYLLVILWPGLAQRLPRPGRWMRWLRVLLGLLLLATALWLLTVLAAQVGQRATLLAAACLLLLLTGLAVHRPARLRPVARLGALLGLAALFILPPLLAGPPGPGRPSGAGWQAFDEAAIPALVAEGQTLFVDVTADWCVTCKVNKAVVFADDRVQALLTGGEIRALQADWTRPDAAIADYLARHGRAGIPFNAVYGPGAPEGLLLPELLTPALVLSAIDAARQPRTSPTN